MAEKTSNSTSFADLFPPKPPTNKPTVISCQKRLSSFFAPKITATSTALLPFSRIPRVPPKNSGPIPLIPYSQETIKEWIFLSVKAIRRYQLEIVEICLFYNTLVCLPTGLGKTFIASLVILNYFLWFPTGKIFFLAPTRPLVNQQKQALFELHSIPKRHIIEITGGVSSEKRKEDYQNPETRVFFMTPQTMENDLKEQRIDPSSIVLIIFDEAHRATGDYAYSNIIKAMDQGGLLAFRVIGLSATPGNSIEQVQQVIDNLMINKLELREEKDPDVKPYLFIKEVVPCVIKRNESIEQVVMKIEELIIQYFRKITVVNEVMEDKAFCYKIRELNRGYFMDIFERFRKRIDLYQKYGKNYMGKMYELFSVVSSLFYGKSLISTQGVQSFRLFLEKFALNSKTKIGTENKTKQELLDSMDFQNVKSLLNDICSSKTAHPKLAKLRELLSDYFNSPETIKNNSKAIIFTQGRNTAQEISIFLNENPRIQSAIFIGQSGRVSTRKKADKNEKKIKFDKKLRFLDKYIMETKEQNIESNEPIETGKMKCAGMSQKNQIATIQAFKANKLNTLIATCIGEEGLDIGDVDLIICYDSGFSPIRMIQRKGRTGRHRDGKVIVLLMEGKELNTYQQNVKKSEGLIKSLKKFSMVYENDQRMTKVKNKKELKFYSFSPRMVPEEETPVLVVKGALLKEAEEEKQAVIEEGKKKKETKIKLEKKRNESKKDKKAENEEMKCVTEEKFEKTSEKKEKTEKEGNKSTFKEEEDKKEKENVEEKPKRKYLKKKKVEIEANNEDKKPEERINKKRKYLKRKKGKNSEEEEAKGSEKNNEQKNKTVESPKQDSKNKPDDMTISQFDKNQSSLGIENTIAFTECGNDTKTPSEYLKNKEMPQKENNTLEKSQNNNPNQDSKKNKPDDMAISHFGKNQSFFLNENTIAFAECGNDIENGCNENEFEENNKCASKINEAQTDTMNVSHFEENKSYFQNENTVAFTEYEDDPKTLEEKILEMDPDNEEINFERMEKELENLLDISYEKSVDHLLNLPKKEYEEQTINFTEKETTVINVINVPITEQFEAALEKNEKKTSNKNKDVSFDSEIDRVVKEIIVEDASFDSELDKVINEIIVDYESSQQKTFGNNALSKNDIEDDLDLIDKLVDEFERNQKKRKVSASPEQFYLKKIKFDC